MNHTIHEAAESHFRSASSADKIGRLAQVRSALKAQERALRIVERKARIETRIAARQA